MSKQATKQATKSEKSSIIEELEIINPPGETVILSSGEEIHVKPYNFKKLLTALKTLTVLLDGMGGTEIDMLKAFAFHGEEVITLIKLATDKNDEFFDTLEADEGVRLAMATYRVNEDFFVQRLLPLINQFQVSTTSPDPESSDLNPEQTTTESEQAGSE